jgi:hypothetical protein
MMLRCSHVCILLWMLILVPFQVVSGIDQKTDSVLEFMYGSIELWHYFIQIRVYLVTGIMLESDY